MQDFNSKDRNQSIKAVAAMLNKHKSAFVNKKDSQRIGADPKNRGVTEPQTALHSSKVKFSLNLANKRNTVVGYDNLN
jgi:hypothetical protein